MSKGGNGARQRIEQISELIASRPVNIFTALKEVSRYSLPSGDEKGNAALVFAAFR
jgi:hypothetical protein